jgi:hypothetical protein
MTQNVNRPKPTLLNHRRALISQLGPPVVILIALWGAYVARLFGFDVIDWLKGKEPTDPTTLLFIVLGFTVLNGVYLIRIIVRTAGLVRHGVEVHGRVTSIGALGEMGGRAIRYEYVYNGQTYKGAFDAILTEIEKYKKNPAILIVVDSSNPSRSQPKSRL